MFDLDSAVAGFLGELTNKRLVNRDARDELESHLWDEMDHQMAYGLSPEEAFQRAITSLGDGATLLAEFSVLHGKSRRAQVANVLSHYIDRRFVMRVLFGAAFGIFFMLGGLMAEGGNLSSIIGVTAFLIVAGGATGALLIAYPLKIVSRSIGLAATGREATRTAFLDAARVFSTFGDLALLAGGVGLIFGLIHVLEHLDKPDMMGLGAAVALLNVLYSLLIKLFISKPLSDSFEARAAVPIEGPETRGGRGDLLSA